MDKVNDEVVFLHEVKTDVNGVMGMLDMIIDKNSETSISDDLEETQDLMRSLVNKMNGLLKELGSCSEEFKVKELISDIGKSVEKRLIKRPVSLVYHGDPGMIIQSDKEKIRRILLNIVDNAINFTKKGEIEIRFKIAQSVRKGTLAVFKISDTGCGIQKDHIDSIFEPYHQANNQDQAITSGSGIGLAIVKHYVDSLKGRISVESSRGRGSVFTLEIPVAYAREEIIHMSVYNDCGIFYEKK